MGARHNPRPEARSAVKPLAKNVPEKVTRMVDFDGREHDIAPAGVAALLALGWTLA